MNMIISEKVKKFILIGIFLLSIFLITFDFTNTPKVWVDEGVFTQVARNFAFHGILGMKITDDNYFLTTSHLSAGYPVIFSVASSFRIFGLGVWQARLPMIIYMFILVVLIYIFNKKKYGFYAGITSVLLVLSFSPFYGNGRPVQGEVPGLVFFILGLLFLLYWEESLFTNKRTALFSGLFFGFACAIKPIFLFLLPIAIISSLIIKNKDIKKNSSLILFGSAFLVPVLLWFLIQFPTIESLKTIIPLYSSVARFHDSSISMSQAILGNLLRFFTESTPILFTLLLATIIASFLIKFNKYKKFKQNFDFSVTESVAVIYIFLNIIGYSFGSGWYRYFFPSHMLAYLFFSGAILYLSKQFINKNAIIIVLSIPILLIIFQFINLVFFSQTSFVVSRTKNILLSEALSNIDKSKSVLFYDAPEAVVFLKSENYYQYFQMANFIKFGEKDYLKEHSFDYIVIDSNQVELDFIPLNCYKNRKISSYTFYEKKPNCVGKMINLK